MQPPAPSRAARPSRLRALRALLLAALVLGPAWAASAAADAVPEAPDLPGVLVYNRKADGEVNWDLFSSAASGADERRVLNTKDQNPQGEDRSRWSPDGEEIVYTTRSRNGDRTYIWRVPYSGGTPTPVVDVIADDAGHPAWRPDGQGILFSGARAGGGPSGLDLMVWTAGGTTTLLDSAQADERDADWSRAHGRIAFASRRLAGGDPSLWWTLHVMNADGSGEEELFSRQYGTVRYPRWSPDGSRIAFIVVGDEFGYGAGQLLIMDYETRQIVEPIRSGVAFPPAWSPDGAWLLVYNTLEAGFALPDQPTPTKSPGEQLLGLYALRLADRALFRLRGPAGGASAKVNSFEWGQYADWSAGTATPTLALSPTPTPSASPTASPTASHTPEASRTPSRTASPEATPSPSATRTASPTATDEPQIPIYLPAAYRNSTISGDPARRNR